MNDMNQPKLTVLMSVKNGEPFVRETVQSVLSQTYADFRFLIIDNASKDNTRAIIEGFGDPRIELVALPEDMGQTGALNLGLARAESEYVARLDADDVCMPERLARQVAFLDANPQIALVGTQARFIDRNGALLGHVTEFPEGHGDIVGYMPITNPIVHPSVMFRLAAVRDVGGYDGSISYAQDLALWIALAEKYRLANLPDALLKLRVHPGQETRNVSLGVRRLRDNLQLSLRIYDLRTADADTRALAMLRHHYMHFLLGERREALVGLGRTLLTQPHRVLFNRRLFSALRYALIKTIRIRRLK